MSRTFRRLLCNNIIAKVISAEEVLDKSKHTGMGQSELAKAGAFVIFPSTWDWLVEATPDPLFSNTGKDGSPGYPLSQLRDCLHWLGILGA